jgi:D-ribose pyranase
VRADDVVTNNPRLDDYLHATFPGAEFSTRTHADVLGELATTAKVIVRTGAFEPWGNIALRCGVDVPKWFNGDGVIAPEYYAGRL